MPQGYWVQCGEPIDAKMENSAWLIELEVSSPATPQYWIGSSAWSSDNQEAIRFARKVDAERAAMMMLDGINIRICEHIWDQDMTPATSMPTP